VQHGKTYANLESADEVFSIGLNRAVTMIAEKVARGPRRRFGADPGRPLGDHPTKGGPVVAKNGRYGPYVSHAGVNATLTGDKTPESVTLDEAVALLDARAERGSAAPSARRRKSARAAATSTRPSTRLAAKAPTNGSKKPAAAGKKSPRRTTQAAE
jgi:DNA topoisomerase-1